MGSAALSNLGIVALALGLFPGSSLAGPAAGNGPAPLGLELPEGAGALGVNRQPARPLAKGATQAAPALAVTPKGQVAVAQVRFDDTREWIELRTAPSPEADLGPARVVASGHRAWGPRLAGGSDGSVWMAWCGRKQAATPGDHARSVFVRRVLPGKPGAVVTVSTGKGRACDPDLAVGPDGRLHLAWEQSSADRADRVGVVYRALDAQGRPRGKAERVSSGHFARRPAVLALADGVWVAWDELVDAHPSGADDPDYDVFIRSRGPKGFGAVRAVDARDGIQAAADLAPADGGGVYVAYHSSHRHSLVKWWSLRRVREDGIAELAARDAAAMQEPGGEQQGAEFPSLAVLPDGSLAIASRPSQGAYLQRVAGREVSRPLDLTRHGWGARGMRTVLGVATDGSLLMVRRARRAAVLERFTFAGSEAGPPRFEKVEPGRKPNRPPLGVPVAASVSTAGQGMKAFFGDVHMHSAASDATGPPDEVLARAWVRGLHFAVLTDHDNIVGHRQPPSLQAEIAWLTDAFDARQGFACLHGYEWTTPPVPKGFGHRNVYFKDRPRVSWCAFRGACNDTAKLFAALQGGKALAVPHHTTWTGTDWAAHDEAVQRLLEVVSVHGTSEEPGEQLLPTRSQMAGMTAVDGLAKGLRFGFVGGSDGHGLIWHHGLGRKRDPWRHGLTVAYAPELNRAAIFDALYARRTGATSGAFIRAVIRVAELPIELAGQVGPKVPIQFVAAAQGGTVEVAVVRDGQVVHRVKPGSPSLAGGFVDYEVDPGAHSYYIRVVHRRGDQLELAWSSPVFVTVKANGRSER